MHAEGDRECMRVRNKTKQVYGKYMIFFVVIVFSHRIHMRVIFNVSSAVYVQIGLRKWYMIRGAERGHLE